MNDLFAELGARFERADRKLFLVGGSVRDMVLGREPKDLDFTTDALPDEIEGILNHEGWADAVWDAGREFGTIAARKDGQDVEITTFRFDGPGRKPEVTFTDSLEEDLQRRDFTINTMAFPVNSAGLDSHPTLGLIDPFGGLAHLTVGIIDTPRSAEASFDDDPLRMLRAARFVSQLDFHVSTRVKMTMRGMARRIDGISKERIIAEMDKLLMGAAPEKGLRLLAKTGLLERILPELDWQERVLFRGPVEQVWADLMRDMELGWVSPLLHKLKFSNERVRTVTDLVAWVQRFKDQKWKLADLARVRELIALSGEHLDKLLVLLDDRDLERQVEQVLDTEGHPEPFLTGKEVMEVLDLKPGPQVGQALQFLWQLRLSQGPMSSGEVKIHLVRWADRKGLLMPV